MIYIRYCILFSFFLAGFTVSAQKKTHAVHYKTITDKEFSIGDRIDMGPVHVVPVPPGKDSIVIPDGLKDYRAFIHDNPQITFRLNMIWRQQGIKYPGRTDRTRERLLRFLNDDGSEQDSVCDIEQFHHTFVKRQDSLLRIELEVIGIKAIDASIHGSILTRDSFPGGYPYESLCAENLAITCERPGMVR